MRQLNITNLLGHKFLSWATCALLKPLVQPCQKMCHQDRQQGLSLNLLKLPHLFPLLYHLKRDKRHSMRFVFLEVNKPLRGDDSTSPLWSKTPPPPICKSEVHFNKAYLNFQNLCWKIWNCVTRYANASDSDRKRFGKLVVVKEWMHKRTGFWALTGQNICVHTHHWRGPVQLKSIYQKTGSKALIIYL